MLKVVNISSRTVEVAGAKIKPKCTKIFDFVSMENRQRISAMVAVNILRAYEVEDKIVVTNPENVTEEVTIEEPKTNKRKK